MRGFVMSALVATLLLPALSAAEQANEKPNFSGTWNLDSAKSEMTSTKAAALVWEIEQKGPQFKFAESAPDRKDKLEYQCLTTGKECDLAGTVPAKLSMYYNGPKLVQFYRTGANGDSVTRRQLQLSDDKQAITVEINYIVPEGKAEKLVFIKKQ